MARILATGVATVDLVQLVNSYPHEDDELRADRQFLWRGGNATNTLVVLSQLGHDCRWLGTLADDDLSRIIRDDLDQHGVDYRLSRQLPNSTSPTSHITLSCSSASRTIIHYRDLAELSHEDVSRTDFSAYDWLHIEGRNIDVMLACLPAIRQACPGLRISLEIEKPRDGIEALMVFADHVLFSRHYASARGFNTAESLLTAMSAEQQQRVHVCSWGKQGAWCLPADGQLLYCDAVDAGSVVDTRAAGDVFNAAWIHAMLGGRDAKAGLQFACELAARKCTRFGLNNLVTP